MSKAKTEEEVRGAFIGQIKVLTSYWANLPDIPDKERCDGVAFGILNIIDGCSSLPAFDLLVMPHDEDKQYCIDNDEDYFEKGMMINDCMLHELFCRT